MRILEAFRESTRAPWLQVLKSTLAIVVSWFLSQLLLGTQWPIFAAMAALIIVAPSVNQSFERGIERTIGVVLGVVLATLLGLVFGSASWVVLLAIAAGLAVAWALKLSSSTTNQVVISAMLVLTLGAASSNYAVDRIIETLLGAVIGVVVNAVIVPPVEIGAARRDVQLLGGEIAASLDRIAEVLTAPASDADLTGMLLEARLLRPMQDAAARSIEAARESLRMNPRSRAHRHELESLAALLDGTLSRLVHRIVLMTRSTVDGYDPGLAREPEVAAIADQLRRAAHDVRLAVHLAEADADVDVQLLGPDEPVEPALTRPLELGPPRSTNWMLIGSLAEDARRIREVLVGDSD